MGKNKKFVEKKKAVTFQVVHRSQRDPLAADPNAAPYVLKHMRAPNDRTNPENKKRVGEEFGEYIDDVYGEEPEKGGSRRKPNNDVEMEYDPREWELASYQLPKDGYDYSKHLRPVTGEGIVLSAPDADKGKKTEKKKTFELREDNEEDLKEKEKQKEEEEVIVIGGVRVPKSVLPSDREEATGLLNRYVQDHALEQLKEDPDVVAQLFEFDDVSTASELDDDFVKMADMECSDGEQEEEGSEGVYEGSEGEWEDYGSDDGGSRLGRKELRKIDALSVTSSRAMLDPRMQDEQFDRLLEQYEDDEDGYGDESDEDCKGKADISEYEGVLDEFIDSQKREQFSQELEKGKILSILGKMANDKTKIEYVDEEKKREKWDAETIVSTYSNMENHPRLIREPVADDKKIKLSKKHGIPMGVLPERSTKDRKLSDGSSECRQNAGAPRRKDESKEEKAARKKAVKEERKVARERKKQLKIDFKKEEMKVSSALSKANKAISGGIKL